MENFDASLSTYFKALLGPRDTRVKGWFLLDNYIPTFVCSVIYLLIVWLGPKYMKNKQPFSCRGILVVYNLGLTLLSLYMFCENEGSLISLQDGDCRTAGRASALSAQETKLQQLSGSSEHTIYSPIIDR